MTVLSRRTEPRLLLVEVGVEVDGAEGYEARGGVGWQARWPLDVGTPRSEWIGLYAIPVPQSVTTIPASDSGARLRVELATWDYGEVAEVLHVGPTRPSSRRSTG